MQKIPQNFTVLFMVTKTLKFFAPFFCKNICAMQKSSANFTTIICEKNYEKINGKHLNLLIRGMYWAYIDLASIYYQMKHMWLLVYSATPPLPCSLYTYYPLSVPLFFAFTECLQICSPVQNLPLLTISYFRLLF